MTSLPVTPSGLRAIFVAVFALHAGAARAQSEYGAAPLFPQIADTSHATSEVSAFFQSFFTAKSRHDLPATMQHFSPQLATYTDATFGWPFDSFEALHGVFAQYMPQWPASGISYPTRIIGGGGSAVVAFTDTPELFGGELRILGAVDFKDGKVVRWVDYWDATSFDGKLYAGMRTPDAKYPVHFREGVVGNNASIMIRTVSMQLQRACAKGDAAAAADLFAYDAVYEDMTLRTHTLGRAAIARYLSRVLAAAPYGQGSRLRHVVGNDLGGGFEWHGGSATGVNGGITALELNRDFKITRLTTVYDGRELADSERRALVLMAVDE